MLAVVGLGAVGGGRGAGAAWRARRGPPSPGRPWWWTSARRSSGSCAPGSRWSPAWSAASSSGPPSSRSSPPAGSAPTCPVRCAGVARMPGAEGLREIASAWQVSQRSGCRPGGGAGAGRAHRPRAAGHPAAGPGRAGLRPGDRPAGGGAARWPRWRCRPASAATPGTSCSPPRRGWPASGSGCCSRSPGCGGSTGSRRRCCGHERLTDPARGGRGAARPPAAAAAVLPAASTAPRGSTATLPVPAAPAGRDLPVLR